MTLTCPHCRKGIRLRQKYPYHAGFSNRGFLYCDSCPAILKFGSYNPNYVRIVGDKHPWTLSPQEKKRVEARLKPCPCGGNFRFNARPRCPHCGGDLRSLLPDEMHFFEIGDVVDADKDEGAWKKA